MNIRQLTQKKSIFKKEVYFNNLIIIISLITILFGSGCMFFLTSIKKPPSHNNSDKESHIVVETFKITSDNYPVTISGYGVIKPDSLISLATEITGRVTFVNPNLKTGKIIQAGETLIKIDDSSYKIELSKAKSKVQQFKNTIKKLNKQKEFDLLRIKTLQKNKTITQLAFERKKKLFEDHNYGNKINVEKAETEYNVANDQLNQLLKIISIYPTQIEIAKNELEIAKTQVLKAINNIKKCKLTSSLNYRVKFSHVEIGEVISIGQKIALLANDNILKIEVSVNANDVKNWIKFDTKNKTNWFKTLKKVPCEIFWNEKNPDQKNIGYLSHVANFDEKTRTITLVVKINNYPIKNKMFPLVDGMFCSVNIPGRIMQNVYRLPRQTVSFDNKVNLLDSNNRLKTISVNVVRKEKDYIFIDEGLKNSDIIIKTRLVDPLEGTLIKIDDKN